MYRNACDRFRKRTMGDLWYFRLPHPQHWTEAQLKYMVCEGTTIEDFLDGRGPPPDPSDDEDDDSDGPPNDRFWRERGAHLNLSRWPNQSAAEGAGPSSTQSWSNHKTGTMCRAGEPPQVNRRPIFTIRYNCEWVWKVGLPVLVKEVGLPAAAAEEEAHDETPKRRSIEEEWPWQCSSEKRRRMTVVDHRLVGWPQCEKTVNQIRANALPLFKPITQEALLEYITYSCVDGLQTILMRRHQKCRKAALADAPPQNTPQVEIEPVKDEEPFMPKE